MHTVSSGASTPQVAADLAVEDLPKVEITEFAQSLTKHARN
jgi:hypothetical protein